MSVVAAIRQNRRVWMAGERMVSNEDGSWMLAEPKVFRKGPWLIGYCGGFSTQYELRGADLVNISTVHTLASFLKSIDSGEEDELLVARSGNLWFVQGYVPVQVSSAVMAIGSGSAFAEGAMLALPRSSARKRLATGIAIAIARSPSCGGSVDILST